MRNSIFGHPIILLKYFASVMYITMGVLIGMMPEAFGDMLSGIPTAFVMAFSALLIIYGLSRFYRTFKEYREIQSNQQENE